MGWRDVFKYIGLGAAGVATGGAAWVPLAVSIGTDIVGGVVENRGRKQANKHLQDAAKVGQKFAGQTLAPWVDAGQQQLGTLGSLASMGPEDIHRMAQMDPSMEFRRQEGMRGLEASSAARGTLLTGGTLRDAIQYNSDFAGTEYARAYDRAQRGVNSQFGRASTVAQMGRNAAGQLVDTNTGLITGAGNANAATEVGNTNTWTGVLGSVGNTVGQAATGWGGGQQRESSYTPDAYESPYQYPGGVAPGTTLSAPYDPYGPDPYGYGG